MRHLDVLKTTAVILVAFSVSLIGCERSNGFEGGGKKVDRPAPQQKPQQPPRVEPQPQPMPAPQPAPAPYIPPVAPAPIPHIAPLPPIQPIPPVAPAPIPEPQPAPLPEPEPIAPAPQPAPSQPLNVPQGPSYTNGSLWLPITPIANMERGYQATNPGFRAVLIANGQVAAAGPMTVEAAMNGVKTASAPGNAYPRLIMKVELKHKVAGLQSGTGKLKICLADDPNTPMEQDINCRPTGCYQGERPCGYEGRQVDFTVTGEDVKVTRWHGSRGDADSPTQAALSAYHAIKDSAFVPTAAWEEAQSPLAFDLNKDAKVDLISFHDRKVKFDLDANGHKATTGWVAKKDALLALDINNNSMIDNGSELFGEFSHNEKKAIRRGQKTFKDGFTALAQYDSNFDQKIDAKDKIFTSLVLWQDKNSNGQTDKGELISLKEAKIKSISLFFERASDKDFGNMVNDNDVRLIGEYTTEDNKTHQVVDVWFRYAYSKTVAGN